MSGFRELLRAKELRAGLLRYRWHIFAVLSTLGTLLLVYSVRTTAPPEISDFEALPGSAPVLRLPQIEDVEATPLLLGGAPAEDDAGEIVTYEQGGTTEEA